MINSNINTIHRIMDRIEILNMLNYYTILNELTLPSPGSKSTDLIPGPEIYKKIQHRKKCPFHSRLIENV